MKKLLSLLASLGLAATASAGVAACGTSTGAKTSDNAIVWNNTESIANDDNTVSFGIKSVGRDVDITKDPIINPSDKIIQKWFWDYGSNSLRGTLVPGVSKGSYVFSVTFQLKDSSQSATTNLTVIKNKASTAESTLDWTQLFATADENNNVVSWTYNAAKAGTLVDFDKEPKIETSLPAGYSAVSNIKFDANAKTLTVTLKDGLPKDIVVLNVSLALKDNFGYAESIQLYASKDKTTEKETKVNWQSDSAEIDGNNKAFWTVEDDGFGAELDLRTAPVVSLSDNPNGHNIVKHAKWSKDSKVLEIDFMDGIKKADYKFDVTFNFTNGFVGEFKKTLTAKKVNPTNAEIAMIPDKDYVPANYKNSYSPLWTFTGTNLGLDIDIDYLKGKDTIAVTKWDDVEITGAASKVLCELDNMSIRFLGGSATEHSAKGAHSVTFQVKLTNGFDGTAYVTLHYVLE